MSASITEPLDTIKLLLDEQVAVKCKGERMLRGKLHGYDPHFNLLMGPVKEFQKITRINPESGERETSSAERRMEMLFVRGDCVVLIARADP